MTPVLNNNLLKFNSETLNDVRKEFNLDKPGEMENSINTLQNWVRKQDHFVKKDFVINAFSLTVLCGRHKCLSFLYGNMTCQTYVRKVMKQDYPPGVFAIERDYLERFLIAAKGSIDKAKTRLDRLCTLRTIAPNLFEKCHAARDLRIIRDFFLQTALPELTEDNYRLLVSKMMPIKITSSDFFLEAYQHCVMICEYLKVHDYSQGYYIIVDLNDVNITNVVTNLKLSDFRNILSVIIEGYGIRIKGVYVISPSTVINTLVKIVKQFVSAKISKRINVVKTGESLQEIFPKRLLPQDFGGEQKSLLELFDELNEELSSESHVTHMMEMRHACTNEELRRSDKFSEEYLGMPGSLKQLSVD